MEKQIIEKIAKAKTFKQKMQVVIIEFEKNSKEQLEEDYILDLISDRWESELSKKEKNGIIRDGFEMGIQIDLTNYLFKNVFELPETIEEFKKCFPYVDDETIEELSDDALSYTPDLYVELFDDLKDTMDIDDLGGMCFLYFKNKKNPILQKITDYSFAEYD